MLRLLLIFLLISPMPLQALDLKFRFKDGYCQKNRQPGTNPEFYGECGNLTKGRLVYKKHENKNFTGMTLNSAYVYTSQFLGGQMNHASVRRSIVLQSKFKDIQVQSLDIRGSHFKGVTFEKANLTNLLANGTRFTKTQFQDCDLTDADFWGSQLMQVDFSGSNLSGANLQTTVILFSKFQGAQFNSKTKLPFSEEEALKRGMVKVD
jgi:uncharacterized protein YjbI with pentapeptide repeats